MAKTKKEKKEKKAGKRMKKKELVKALLDFFHVKQDEVLSLKYIFEQLHLTTHPLKMLCMDILSELSDDDYITEVDKHKYKLNNHGVEMTGTFQRKSNGKNSFIPEGGGDPIFIAERNSAHAMADAILNSKISLAKSRGITVQADAHIPVKLKMSELDLCCILGNLFDNAIEASMALPEKDRLIRVYMDMKGTQLYISFTNFTAGKKLEKTGGRFRTTKGEGHGFGLVRIDDIVARLDGYLSRNSEDGAFTTEILLPQV